MAGGLQRSGKSDILEFKAVDVRSEYRRQVVQLSGPDMPGHAARRTGVNHICQTPVIVFDTLGNLDFRPAQRAVRL